MLTLEPSLVGASLPPHLSPFVEEQEGDYTPPERQAMLEAGEFFVSVGVLVFFCHFIAYHDTR